VLPERFRVLNPSKRKVSVSLEEVLVEELEQEDQGLSAQVNPSCHPDMGTRG